MNNTNNHHAEQLRQTRRTANWGLYGSIVAVLLVVIFHFSPWHITYQSPQATRWMLISGAILAVLAIVMALMSIRKTTPLLRQLDSLDQKLKGYSAYISSLYRGSLAIVLIECVLIVLMSDTSLLMITILLILLLFLSYPNMYKIKTDLGLTDQEMSSLFGNAYIADAPAAYDQPTADLPLADAQLAKDEEQQNPTGNQTQPSPEQEQ